MSGEVKSIGERVSPIMAGIVSLATIVACVSSQVCPRILQLPQLAESLHGRSFASLRISAAKHLAADRDRPFAKLRRDRV